MMKDQETTDRVNAAELRELIIKYNQLVSQYGNELKQLYSRITVLASKLKDDGLLVWLGDRPDVSHLLHTMNITITRTIQY